MKTSYKQSGMNDKEHSYDLPTCLAFHTIHDYFFYTTVLSSLIPHCQVKVIENQIPFVWVFCCWFVFVSF